MEYIHWPTLAIYWADTKELLTHCERHNVAHTAIIIDVTPHEILLEEEASHRKIVIRGTLDPFAPDPDSED